MELQNSLESILKVYVNLIFISQIDSFENMFFMITNSCQFSTVME